MPTTTRRPTPAIEPEPAPTSTVPTVDPPPARAHVPIDAHVDPVVKALLGHLETTTKSASTERTQQTEQFTSALDKLGGRFESKMDMQTQAVVTTARYAAGIVVLTLVLLGSIAGAVTYFKGGGYEAGTNQNATTSAK